jgi:hypothetical protein
MTLPYFGSGEGTVSVPESLEPELECFESVDFAAPTSIESAASQLIGLWTACTQRPDGFSGDHLLFQTDGTFQVLSTDEAGTVAPAPGCLQAGLWGFGHEVLQLNTYTGVGTRSWFVRSAGGDMLLLRSATPAPDGVYDTVFVRRAGIDHGL